MLSQYTGLEFVGTFPMEAGGVNSMVPIASAASLGIPLVDCDGMGRAFPELQMVTFYRCGVADTPMDFTDEKGNAGVIKTNCAQWAERLARVTTVEMGGSDTVALYPSNGQQIKTNGIRGIDSLCETVGLRIRDAHLNPAKALAEILEVTNGHLIFEGQDFDVVRRTERGFNVGDIQIDGLHDLLDTHHCVLITNENLLALRNELPIVMTPDLIEIVDADTLLPVTTEVIKYGQRVQDCATPADARWRTQAGITTAGPRYFGFDYD